MQHNKGLTPPATPLSPPRLKLPPSLPLCVLYDCDRRLKIQRSNGEELEHIDVDFKKFGSRFKVYPLSVIDT
jgi:hypothetical protein